MSGRVYLIEKSRSLKGGKQAVYYKLRWKGSQGQWQEQTVGRTRKSGGDTTKAQAEDARRAKELALGSGKHQRDNPQKVTLRDYADEFLHHLEHEKKLRLGTVKSYRRSFNYLCEHLGPRKLLASITPADATSFTSWLHEKGLHQNTVRLIRMNCKTLVREASSQGLIHTMPWGGKVMNLGRQTNRKRPLYFTKEECRAMYEAAPNQWWEAFIRLGATTGLRLYEMLNLRWEDLDLDGDPPTLTVQAREAEAWDEAGRRLFVLAWAPKTVAGERTVPIPASTVDALRRMRIANPGSPYVFIPLERVAVLRQAHDDGRLGPGWPVGVEDPSSSFKEIQAEAQRLLGVARWRPRTTRHLRSTYGTLMAEHVPMNVLKALMGHEDIQTTATYYAGVTDEQLHRAAEAAVA